MKEVIKLKDIEKINTLMEPVRKGYRYLCIMGKGVYRVVAYRFQEVWLKAKNGINIF